MAIKMEVHTVVITMYAYLSVTFMLLVSMAGLVNIFTCLYLIMPHHAACKLPTG